MVPDVELTLLSFKKTLLEAPYAQRLNCINQIANALFLVGKNKGVSFRDFLYKFLSLAPQDAYLNAYAFGVNNYVEHLDLQYSSTIMYPNSGYRGPLYKILKDLELSISQKIDRRLNALIQLNKNLDTSRIKANLLNSVSFPEDEFGICSPVASTDEFLTLAGLCCLVHAITCFKDSMPLKIFSQKHFFLESKDLSEDVITLLTFNNVSFLCEPQTIDKSLSEIAKEAEPDLVETVDQCVELCSNSFETEQVLLMYEQIIDLIIKNTFLSTLLPT